MVYYGFVGKIGEKLIMRYIAWMFERIEDTVS